MLNPTGIHVSDIFPSAAPDTGCPVCGSDSCELHIVGAARPIVFTLAQLAEHRFPARRALLTRGNDAVLREGHLGQVYAERGIGKTWLLYSLALAAASGSEVLGFRAPSAVRVGVIDGEMGSEEVQERLTQLAERQGIRHSAANLRVLAADWQLDYLPRLDTAEGQRFVQPVVDDADLVILDNRSCLFDPEGEKDPSAWQPAQDWLLSLRRRGKAVLLGHHSNRQGGARGHSKSEDPMNLLIKLARPEGYGADEGARFLVTFEKSRGAYGAAVAPFEARLTDSGWAMTGIEPAGSAKVVAGKLLDYLRIAAAAGESPRSASAACAGAKVQKSAGLKAWGELLERGLIAKHPKGGFRVV